MQNNCGFFKHGWTPGGKNVSKEYEPNGWLEMGLCSGILVGETELGHGWEPLCQAHYEFSLKKNAESESKDGWTKLRPLSGQPDMVKPDMIIPAKEIPEFCEYCETDSGGVPPQFKCKPKPPSKLTRYLCENCMKNSSWASEGTNTPLGDSTVEQQSLPSFMCNIEWSDLHENGSGGSEQWGKCDGPPKYLAKNSPKANFDDPPKTKYPGPVASCEKHHTIWKNAKWEIKLISEVYGKNPVTESPEYGQVQKYDDPQEHKSATNNKFFCEQDMVTGFDGTQKHFGEVYHLECKDPYLYRIACDNHAGVYINEGCLVENYGTHNTGAWSGPMEKPGIPDCLLAYIPNYTIDNCWFRMNCKEGYDWSIDYGNPKYEISGPCKGKLSGYMSGQPVCKIHVEFVNKMNKVGNFGTIMPVQKMEIPELVCKIKWNETTNNGGMTCKGEGECAGQWYICTKIGVVPSFDFDYEGYSCFPICENHKHIFLGSTLTSVNDIINGKTKKTVKKPAKPKMPKPYEVRTQKAKGLQALKDTYFPVPGFQIYDVKTANPDTLVGKFVRPCPMRPRHGFVDSRTVSSREDAEKIITETLAADPEAEFLLMDYVPAPFSGIWTPGYLAIGKGTDGATAGKTAITIPIMGDFLARGGYSSSAKTKASIESAPYVEILWKKQLESYQGLTVQLRDGPKLPEGSEDYIPNEFTVANIIHADGDLLEWEDKMRHVPENTVVWHPNGTMASHYAIHAVLNKVPLLITREPKIGEILKPTENQPGEVNIDLIRAGFGIACDIEISMTEAAYFMLLGCHQTSQWLGKFDILLGASMGCAYRLAMTAALGEERHYATSKGKQKRDTVYHKVWKKADTQYGRTQFMDALEKFLNGNQWPGSNYGGKAWYQFTSQAIVMYNALIHKEHKQAMEAMNKLVNAAHNSGWGFNKFITQDEMTKTAKNPIYSGFHVGPYLYEILTASNETVKSAARSFWKRKPLELPVDKGTGVGKAKTIKDEEDYDEDEDHESACDDEDCPSCHPKPPHVFSESCECNNCKKKKWGLEGNKPQIITQAHVKVYGKGSKMMAHIQYKSENCPAGAYWTKDFPCPTPIWKMYQTLAGKYDESYAESGTKYIIMIKIENADNLVSDAGWGVVDPSGKWTKLLDLEVTPNAS